MSALPIFYAPLRNTDGTELELTVTDFQVEPARLNKISKNGQEFKWTNSRVVYLKDVVDPKTKQLVKQKCDFYMECPSQFCFGLSGNWDTKIPEKDRHLENMDGMQLMYSLTSLATHENPTEDEQIYKRRVDMFQELTQLAFVQECTRPDAKDIIPTPVINAYKIAKMDDDMSKPIKPAYDFPNKPKTKIQDTSKPPRMYLPLDTSGKGKDLRCKTLITGPGNKNIDAKRLLPKNKDDRSAWGQIKPVVNVQTIGWGQRNQTSFVAAIKYVATEMTWLPGSTTVARPRMLDPVLVPEGVECDVPEGFDGDADNDNSAPASSSVKDSPVDVLNQEDFEEVEEPPKPTREELLEKAKEKTKSKSSKTTKSSKPTDTA